MSTLPNLIYPVTMLVESSVAASSEHRLVELNWKSTKGKDGKTVPPLSPARCVSIPKLAVVVEPANLQEPLQEAFEEMQQSVIKAKVEAAIRAKQETITINDADISPSGIAEWHKTTGGGHLSTAKAEAWFDNSLAPVLTAKVFEKLNIDTTKDLDAAAVSKVEAVVKNYRDKITKLAAPTAQFNEELASQLKVAVSLAPDDKIRTRFIAKLDAMLKPADELMLALS